MACVVFLLQLQFGLHFRARFEIEEGDSWLVSRHNESDTEDNGCSWLLSVWVTSTVRLCNSSSPRGKRDHYSLVSLKQCALHRLCTCLKEPDKARLWLTECCFLKTDIRTHQVPHFSPHFIVLFRFLHTAYPRTRLALFLWCVAAQHVCSIFTLITVSSTFLTDLGHCITTSN